MDDIEKIKLREFEDQFGEEIDNWRRWALLRDYLPPSQGTIIGSRYQPKNREAEQGKIRKTLDLNSAVMVERIVSAMPDQHRKAFVLQYIGKVAINGRIKFARTKRECAKTMGIGKTKYYGLLIVATMIINRELTRH